jgi:AcrR family transcriptional regulator
MSDRQDGKSRSRANTTEAILHAAVETLESEGFSGFGVNAVARRAGCDKQLVYRYFGGAEGLSEAVGEYLAQVLTEGLSDDEPAGSYGALMEQLAVRLMRVFRDHPLLARVAAWEATEPSALAPALAAKRGAVMARWMEERRGALTPPPGIDAAATNALIIGAVQYLALAGRTMGAALGLPLKEEKHWERAEHALRALVRAAYRAA